jgi:hypothetical protein
MCAKAREIRPLTGGRGAGGCCENQGRVKFMGTCN